MANSKNLIIYSGPIRSGKTTRLYNYFKDRDNVAGILSLLIAGKKYLYSLRTKNKKLLEIDKKTTNKSIITVGQYTFDNSVFEWGRQILSNDLKKCSELIIIDEIGQLELSNQGLAPTAFDAINAALEDRQKVLVVVRDTLQNNFLSHIKLNNDLVSYFNFDF